MDNKRLINVGEPKEHKDAVNREYLRSFHRKNEDIDMNNKAIKNLSWPNDNNDAVPKKYLYQYELLLDNKINSFNAKDKKIVDVLDPENLQDVATKNHVYSLDSAIQDSLMKRITDANINRIKNVGDPVEDGDAFNKKHKIKGVPVLYFDKISEKNGRLFCNPVYKEAENLLPFIVTLNYKKIFIKP
jgi:hypothetical protein